MCQVQKVTSGSVFKALRPVSGTRGTLQGWLVTSICLLFPISSRTFISWPRRWAASLPLAPSLLESSGSLGYKRSRALPPLLPPCGQVLVVAMATAGVVGIQTVVEWAILFHRSPGWRLPLLWGQGAERGSIS